MTRRRSIPVGLAVTAAVVAMVGCSSSTSTTSSTTMRPAPTTTVDRPTGPVPTLSINTGSKPPFVASAGGDALGDGYTEREYVVAGSATTFEAPGGFTPNGRWSFRPTTSAPYRTRIVVRAPKDPSAFSGTVAVEWLYVSGGLDAAPDWSSLHTEIERNGDAWVGVSAQTIGVMGGPVLVSAGTGPIGQGLVKIDPERYRTLQHPGDGYAFDIFTQVGRAIRSGSVLGPLRATRLIAVGESQSAFALVTYYNGVQPLAGQFDGFFVHSRGAVGLPLAAPGKAAGIADAIGGTPVIFRTDRPEPVMNAQTESDITGVINSVAARQPDSTTYRLWEVAGTAHADRSMVGKVADQLQCGVEINDGPMRFVARAAFRALVDWMTTKRAPQTAPRLNTTGTSPPELARDRDGIAIGGIRTPLVDAPVDVLSSVTAPNPSTICLLLGSTTPLPPQRLVERYGTRAEYLQQYTRVLDSVVEAGWILPADRAAVLALAQPDRVGK